jgi:hypothetical protein
MLAGRVIALLWAQLGAALFLLDSLPAQARQQAFREHTCHSTRFHNREPSEVEGGIAVLKTQSEKWFEDYCVNSEITCKRILEDTNPTPDYELTMDGQQIIVEVKEITRNREERESYRLVLERGYGNVLSDTPGDRVRKKITDSSPQIKARTHGVYPSILVLCDLLHGCGQITGHLDPYNIRVAMYGLERIHMTIPRDHTVRPYITGMS